MDSQKPVVVILGATGVGKSKLALDLSNYFDCEIVSADSMQIYKGLDIITNKVTTEERALVPHHCIDYVDPLLKYTVIDFRNKSLPIMNSLLEKGKIPLVVGGTNYYIESLLWNVLIDSDASQNYLTKEREDEINKIASPQEMLTKHNIKSYPITKGTVENLSNEYLYNLLKEIDPDGCVGLHPNTRRKVIRRLQIFQQTGKTYTQFISEQNSNNDGCLYGGPLRFKNSVILWLQCDRSVLSERLNQRIDSMMENGLIEELSSFHEQYNKRRFEEEKNADYTEGIFQSIGFKEFHPYLILSKEARDSRGGKKILNDCVKNMKLATFRYAKYQEKWIRNRFLKSDRKIPAIFPLNTTDLTNWQQNVSNIAIEIVKSFVAKKPLPANVTPLEKETFCEDDSPAERRRMYRCNECERVIIGTKQWKHHLKSSRHERVLFSRKQLCKLLEQRELQLKAKAQA